MGGRTVIRRAIDLALVALVAVVLVLTLATHVAPELGGRLFAIRSGSMAPGVPIGALIVTKAVEPEALAVGNIVTVGMANGTALTHRIAEVVQQDDARMIRLKGDANPAADPTLVNTDQVIGEVTLTLPFLGYLLAMLAMPSGLVAFLSFAASLLILGWLLDDLSADRDPEDLPPPSPPVRRVAGVVNATVLVLGLVIVGHGVSPVGFSWALATSLESAASSMTADVLDPPASVTCSGGLLICNVSLIAKPVLNWTATPDAYATGYRVLRSTVVGGTYSQIATVTGRTSTTFTDTTVSALTTYYYVVRSEAPVWVSLPSNVVTVIVAL